MHLCLFEDLTVKNLHPLTYLNPVFELRCGCTSLREKIISRLPRKKIIVLTRSYLHEYTQELYPGYQVNSLPDDDILFINGRALANDSLAQYFHTLDGGDSVALNGDEVVAAFVTKNRVKRLKKSLREDGFNVEQLQALPSQQINCRLIKYPWDLVSNNTEEIEKDFIRLKSARKQKPIEGKIYPGVHLLNKKNIRIGKDSTIKPGVVLDAEHGPIILGNNVTIMPNAVIEGPVYIGDSTTIKIGAKIYPGTSIGAFCKIGGEVTRSIIQSYSNKAHDGFVGDSYIGSWVNLGADTNTSNLKNTYGAITVIVNGKPVDSGRQFVGLTMGDHSKSGINVMFNTGTVVGVSCNIYGPGLPPKFLPSFSWGNSETYSIFELDKSIEVASRMMERRTITLSKAYRTMLEHVFNQTKQERKQWLKK